MSGLSDVERNYRSALSKTPLRSDRGDLGLYTFAGSNLHGGVPAANRGSMPRPTRSTTLDLYAPINTADYGKGYYDHLRADSPTPRIRPSATFDFFENDYNRLAQELDDLKTTTKKTTITEKWLPLTSSYMYSTPYHTYYYRSTPFVSYLYRSADDYFYNNYYLDDYHKRTTTTTTRSKNIDALDLSISSKSYVNKCQTMQSQVSELCKTVYEAEMKLKNEVVNARNSLQADLTDVGLVVEDTARYNDDLYRAIKKQAKQISSLNKKYDDINIHIADVSETLEKTRSKCLSLQSDITSMQSTLELSMKRRYW